MPTVTGISNEANENNDQNTQILVSAINEVRNAQSAGDNAIVSTLTAQHDILISTLVATNQKLDQIAAALEALTPQPDDTTQQMLLALQSIDNKSGFILDDVEAMRTAIAPLGEVLPQGAKVSVIWLLHRIMMSLGVNTPTSSTGAVTTLLQAVLSQMVPLLSNIASSNGVIRDGIGVFTNVGDYTVRYYLSEILAATGPLNGSSETIRYLLNALTEQDPCACISPGGGVPPLQNACSSPFRSSGMFYVVAGTNGAIENQTIATWPQDPLTRYVVGKIGQLPQTDFNSVQPVPGYAWVGKRLYVQSNATTYARSYNGDQRYLTNTWYSLTGYDPITVSIIGAGSVTAYFCEDTTAPPILFPGDCVSGSSQLVGLPFGEPSKQIVVWGAGVGVKKLPDKDGEATDYVYYPGDMFGAVVTASIAGIDCYTYDESQRWGSFRIPAGGATVSIHTTYVAFYNNTTEQSFSIEMCMPAEGAE